MTDPGLARIRVRMYQVGFGDCFLVSFEYDGALAEGRNERQLLIDFGTRRLAQSKGSLTGVARKIAEHSGGHLDVVVVTHRHLDHLSAFGQAGIPELLTPNGPPALVVRSWTEDPALAADATGPAPGGPALARPADAGPGERSQKFLKTIEHAQAFGGALGASIAGAPRSQLGQELGVLAAGQMPNAGAVNTLAGWADAGTGTYLYYGVPSGIEDVIPGIKVTVLGPPTVEQHPAVTTQRESDPEEFWMLYKGLVESADPQALLQGLTRAGAAARGVGPIGPVRWLTDRMGRQQLNSLLRITRTMDDVLNNTSVILLFEAEGAAGTTRMLFPGDAQIENWEYALKYAADKDDNIARLAEVDLYKVGHHGSRNATPRSLFDLWTQPGTPGRKMTAMMSTKYGVFGKTDATAVPRQTLVDALTNRMTLRSTASMGATAWAEVVADLGTGTIFDPVPAAN